MNRNAVGIDVSKGYSTIAVRDISGAIIVPPFDVRHTRTGLAGLAERLKELTGDTRIVMEHTGRYYESIANVLHEKGSVGISSKPAAAEDAWQQFAAKCSHGQSGCETAGKIRT